ncbi:hypothetical protein Unana1_07921 [Umbelopsis nana]
MDIINTPLRVLENLFENYNTTSNNPSEFDASNYLCDLLQKNLHLQKIPSLNVLDPANLPADSLVRFRCMVQDTNLGPEIYLNLHEVTDSNSGQKVLKCTKYSDADFAAMDDFNEGRIPNDYLDERSVLYCISPPGESDWVKQADTPTVDQQIANMSLIEQHGTDMDDNSKNKFPLPGVPHVGVIVKLYGADKNVEVGSRIEVIGVLSKPNSVISSTEPIDDFDLPKPSFPKTQVVHGIYHRRVDSMEALSVSQEEISTIRQQAGDLRVMLLEYLADVFGGDTMVAEYVLLQLLSRVTSKRGAFALGQFCLNITEFPVDDSAEQTQTSDDSKLTFTSINSSTRKVSTVLKKLLSTFVELPLSLPILNGTSFYPKSNDENLLAGVLQLLDGTCVLVDETVLKEGTLKDQGVKNMRALNKAIQQQLLGYAYPFHEFDLSIDLGFIVLSRAKSMFPSATLPLQTQEDNGSLQISEDVLQNFRRYLHVLKYAEYDIPESISEHIQQRFVQMRKEASSQSQLLPTQEDLMLQLNLARLVALSFGSSELTQELYDYTINLEKMRLSRLEPYPSAQPQK